MKRVDDMDEIDIQILKQLVDNARVTASEISSSISLSVPAVNNRIKKLIESGVIEKFTIIINPEKIGKSLTALIFVNIELPMYINGVLDFIKNEKSILECFATAGDNDYCLKIMVNSILDLENLILRIKKVKGVIKTKTVITLYTHKSEKTIIPD